MGVPKLLQYLGPLLRTTNLYGVAEGKRIGVDGHVWLHQFAYHWAEDIVYHKNYEPLAREFLQQAQYVLGQGVEVFFVFDGAPTPAKRCTDQERQRRRAVALANIMHGSNTDPSAAALRAAVSLGWPAVQATISVLRKHGIPYLVAPYEADSQLALLAKGGHVWAVATVDSDFIIHGIQRIFFRVSWGSGRAAFWDRSLAENWQGWPNEDAWKTDFLTILASCGCGFLTAYTLAAGCDYNTKITNVGPAGAMRACKAVMVVQGESVFADLNVAVPFLADELKLLSPSK